MFLGASKKVFLQKKNLLTQIIAYIKKNISYVWFTKDFFYLAFKAFLINLSLSKLSVKFKI